MFDRINSQEDDMAEEQIVDSNQDQYIDAHSIPSESSVSQEEPLYTKEDVSRIVKRNVWETKQKLASPERQPASISVEDVRKLAAEAANRMFEEKQQQYNEQLAKARHDEELKNATQVANSFLQQVELAKQKHSDFEELVDPNAFGNMTHYLPMLEKTGIAGDILHYFGNNPKFQAEISILARENPKAAERELQKIASSLQLKHTAEQVKRPNEPLDHMQQSNIGIGSGSSNPDYSNKSWIKF